MKRALVLHRTETSLRVDRDRLPVPGEYELTHRVCPSNNRTLRGEAWDAVFLVDLPLRDFEGSGIQATLQNTLASSGGQITAISPHA